MNSQNSITNVSAAAFTEQVYITSNKTPLKWGKVGSHFINARATLGGITAVPLLSGDLLSYNIIILQHTYRLL